MENLDELSFDLISYRSGGHVTEHGPEMDMEAGALARGYLDLLNFDQSVRQFRGQEMLSFDRRHAEY